MRLCAMIFIALKMKECKVFLVSTAEKLVNCVRHTNGFIILFQKMQQ